MTWRKMMDYPISIGIIWNGQITVSRLVQSSSMYKGSNLLFHLRKIFLKTYISWGPAMKYSIIKAPAKWRNSVYDLIIFNRELPSEKSMIGPYYEAMMSLKWRQSRIISYKKSYSFHSSLLKLLWKNLVTARSKLDWYFN